MPMYKELPAWGANGWVRLWFKGTEGMVNPPETGYPLSYGWTVVGSERFFCCRWGCSSMPDGDVDLRLLPLKSSTEWVSMCWLVADRADDDDEAKQWVPVCCSVPQAAKGATELSFRGVCPTAVLVLGELCLDSRAAAASAYCCSSLIISGLSGEMGRVSSSVLGSLGEEALCLPLLVDSRDGPWDPVDKGDFVVLGIIF